MSAIYATKYEYRIAQVQYNRVTFVDGQWEGQMPPQNEKAIESCPLVWDYLNTLGYEGWRLSNVIMMSESKDAQILYLMREK